MFTVLNVKDKVSVVKLYYYTLYTLFTDHR